MEHRLLTRRDFNQPHPDSLQVTPVDFPHKASTRVHTSCAPGTQATTPWTLLEAGFNFNHTKDLLRLLRDRGVLAGNRVGTAPSGSGADTLCNDQVGPHWMRGRLATRLNWLLHCWTCQKPRIFMRTSRMTGSCSPAAGGEQLAVWLTGRAITNACLVSFP